MKRHKKAEGKLKLSKLSWNFDGKYQSTLTSNFPLAKLKENTVSCEKVSRNECAVLWLRFSIQMFRFHFMHK
jgi:hypothetical protein